MIYRLHCLGQLALWKEGAPLPPGAIQPRRLALLAILAASGDRAVARDKLAALLWPDSDEERSRRSVAQALYALRRDLGHEEAIVGVRDLRLNDEIVASDVGAFLRHQADGSLEQAAALYEGPFLDGFRLSGLAEFERFLEDERRAWADRFREVVESLARTAERDGEKAAAVRWWRAALAQDPHNARLTRHLMRALHRQGDRAGAIRQAEIYATLVRTELDIAPDPAVLREAEEIRNADTSHAFTEELPVPAADPAAVPGAAATPVSVSDPAATTATAPASNPQPTAAATDATASGPDAISSEVRPYSGAGRSRRVAWIGVAGIGALALFVLLPELRRDSAPMASPSRVLVVPPRNATGDSTLHLLGTMVAEWITTGLSQTGLVDVIDARSMLEAARDAATDTSLRAFAASNRVGTIVTGSVFRDGDSLTFDLRITDARTGELRQSIPPVAVPATRPTLALEPLRQHVMGALAVLFDIQMHNRAAMTSQPPTWEAYQEFLVGMQEFGADFRIALRHFERAIALDSSYWQARLWAGITNANLRRYPQADSIFRSLVDVTERLAPYDRATWEYFEHGFVNGRWEGSYRGARRMVELAPSAGHALYALGTTATFTGRHLEALDVLEQIDREHGWGLAWASRIENLIARNFHALGRHGEELRAARRMQVHESMAGWARVSELRALAALRRYRDLDQRVDAAMTLPVTEVTWEPFSPGDMLLTVAREIRAHGDTARAREYLERANRWYLERPSAEGTRPATRRGLARVLYTLGRWQEAGELFGDLHSADTTNLEDYASLGLIAAHTGDSAYATTVANALAADRRRWAFGAPPLWAARIAAALGRDEQAVALLRRAIAEGHTRAYLFHTDPDLGRLMAFAPLQELLAPRP